MNRKIRTIIEFSVAFGFMSLSYVNCSRTYDLTSIPTAADVQASEAPVDTGSIDSESDGPAQPLPDMDDNRGIAGGHFDLDTASVVSAYDKGSKDFHVHEYDNKFDVTSVNFFNMLDGRFTRISDRVQPSQVFYIVIGNSELSPGAHVNINGNVVDLLAYRQLFEQFLNGTASLPKFSLDGSGGATKLTSLSVEFDVDVIARGGLVPTRPVCVFDNRAGPHGEYRNGALTIQIVEVQKAIFNAQTKTAAIKGGMLWESMVYWHKPDASCL